MEKRNSRLKKILITGIPASGKTTIGNYFRDELHYLHCDLERLCDLDRISKTGIAVNFRVLIRALKECKKNVIVTWGFSPASDIPVVRRFKNNGFRLFWFDGNRLAAFHSYFKRGTTKERGLYAQMVSIEVHNVIERINPVLINPFKNDFCFRRKRDIAKEILNKMRNTVKD